MAVAVGQEFPPPLVPGEDENALSLVIGANGRCGEQTPLRIEPEGGKVSKDELKSAA